MPDKNLDRLRALGALGANIIWDSEGADVFATNGNFIFRYSQT